MRRLGLVLIIFFLSSCSVSDVQNITRAVISKDPSSAIKTIATMVSVPIVAEANICPVEAYEVCYPTRRVKPGV